MGDSDRTVLPENFQKLCRVSQISIDECECFGGEQVAEVTLFMFSGVIRIEIVVAHHFIAALQERFGQSRTNKSGGTGDQNFHNESSHGWD